MSAVLYDLMKKAAEDAMQSTTFTEIVTAVVDSVSPIRLILDSNSLVITADMIILPELYSAPNTILQEKDKIFVLASSNRDMFFILSPDPTTSRSDLINGTNLPPTLDNHLSPILTGLNNALAAAQLSADGKNKVRRETYPPNTNDGFKTGDQWWVYSGTDNSIVVGFYLFTGSIWVQQVMDNAIFANIDAGKIKTGIIDTNRISIIPQTKVENLQSSLAGLTDASQNANAKADSLLNVIQIDQDGIKIGQAGGGENQTNFSVKLDYDSLDFMEDSVVVAQVTSRKLWIREADIATTPGTSLLLGAHSISLGGTGALLNKVTVFRGL